MIRALLLRADHRFALAKDWITKRLGRRGATLLTLATVDLVIGTLLINPGLHAQTVRTPAYRLIVYVPLQVWGAAWIAVGLVCGISAWRRSDRLAFGLAIMIKLLWGGLILGAWLFKGATLAWAGAVVWFALAAWVAISSGWPERPNGPSVPSGSA